ncbi:MAG: hypothetical protein GEU93_17290 [Propionibacteriales bacterium]|nr:hypothetical protein [Propionibacteriales bacterium]
MNPSRLTVAASATAVLLLVMVGCDSDDANADPESAPSSPVETKRKPKPTPTLSPDEREVLSAYRRYVKIEERALLAGKLEAMRGIGQVAGGNAVYELRRSILDAQRYAERYVGRVQRSPKVQMVDQKTSTATIVDCFDVSDTKIINVRTGKPKKLLDPEGNPAPRRYRATIHLERHSDRWLVVGVKPHQEQPC